MTHVATAGVTPVTPQINPVGKAVYDALASHDLSCATRFLASYVNIPGSASVQLVHMNRYWRRQLDRLDVDTINERECLMDDCALSDWLRHFQNGVMPTVLAHGLPIL